MIHPSTFSIVAYDPAEQAFGIAVASKFLAVGAVVPWARARAGAVATQSYANTTYGPLGLDTMENGASAQEALQALLKADPLASQRQVGIVDSHGGSATHTGIECNPWAGGVHSPGYAIQGNILVGPGVVAAMKMAYLASTEPFYWRLYAALRAGDEAGGDRRGRQSAAILVVKSRGGYAGFNDRWIDYRVDDDPDPVARLKELLALHDLYFGESDVQDKVSLQGEPLIRLQRIMAVTGDYHGLLHGEYDDDTRRALDSFIGRENFEDRTDLASGRLDRPVFDYLVARFEDRPNP